MVRIKKADGSWEDFVVATPAPEHFQRADGSRLTDEQIAAAAKAVSQQEASRATFTSRTAATTPRRRRGSANAKAGEATELEAEAIAALASHPSRSEAARSLGITVSALEGRLRKARARGVDVGRSQTTQVAVVPPAKNGLNDHDRDLIKTRNEAARQLIAAGVLDDRQPRQPADDDSDAPIVDDLPAAAAPTLAQPASVDLDSTLPEWPDEDVDELDYIDLSGRQTVLVLRAALGEVASEYRTDRRTGQPYLIIAAAQRIVDFLAEYDFELTVRCAQ